MNLIKIESAEVSTPILLNGKMQRCVYSVDCSGDLCQAEIDLGYFFGVLSGTWSSVLPFWNK